MPVDPDFFWASRRRPSFLLPALKEIFSASAISGDVERLNKSLPIFMGRFLIDPLAKINLVTAKNSN
jgi:hypothetical protein